jgi:hypothetical protein
MAGIVTSLRVIGETIRYPEVATMADVADDGADDVTGAERRPADAHAATVNARVATTTSRASMTVH